MPYSWFNIQFDHDTKMTENSELKVLQGNNQFTSNLYKILAEQDGNVFFSPISIHVVLSMAYQGAQGTTAERFADTLKICEAETAAEGYNAVIKRLNSVKKVTLLMANKLYLMDGNTLMENFKSAITKHFLSDVQLVDFRQNKATAKTINNWVKGKTHGKIKDLISENDLNDLTRLVLVNAIYFKGRWKHPFEKSKTKTESFYLNDNDKTDVQMMHIKEEFNYKNDDSLGAQILELPYANEDLSMIIILPHKKNGINELEQKLSNVNFTDVTRGLQEMEVNVSLPKFKIETIIDLENSLTKIGLGEIFHEDKANFKGMLENTRTCGNLYISKIIQKAFIEVNEEGTEAVAVIDMVWEQFLDSSSIPRPVPNFKADHPFIFILTEKRNNQLFFGRICNPNNL